MSPRHDCEVCNGSGRIIVPLTCRVAFDQTATADSPMLSRYYPCPECNDLVESKFVGTAFEISEMTLLGQNGDEYRAAVRRSASHKMVDALISAGAVAFTESEPDNSRYRIVKITAKLSYIAPRETASLDERIARHQETLARDVMAEACRLVQNWGSYYGGETIGKAEVNRCIDAALVNVLETRAGTRHER